MKSTVEAAAKIASLHEQIFLWEMVVEAVAQEEDPLRDRMVVQIGPSYIATHRWEINPANGYLTVQLGDGSILPTRLGKWCPWLYADDHFGIDREDVVIDDVQDVVMMS